MAHIELKGITKTFGSHTALKNLNIDIADGEFFVLLGQTGAGKTTTLRLIAGLEKPTAGQIFIDGQDVADWGAAERDVAWCFSNIRFTRAIRCGRTGISIEIPYPSR